MSYESINLEMLQVDEECGFDIYTREGDRYLLLVAGSDTYTKEHRNRLIERKCNTLYARDEDADALNLYKVKHLEKALNNPGVGALDKATLAYDTGISTMKLLFSECNDNSISKVEDSAGMIVQSILDSNAIMSDLMAVQSHDHFTYQHSVNVGVYATTLAVELFGDRLSPMDIIKLAKGYFLHDIGMTQIDREILNKSTPLTRLEQLEIRHHPSRGFAMLEESGHLSSEAADIVQYHHERIDGGGYPVGKKGDEIPVYAKICTIADVFEALTADRPYRKGRTPREAIAIMQQEMRRDFEEDYFNAFVNLFDGE